MPTAHLRDWKRLAIGVSIVGCALLLSSPREMRAKDALKAFEGQYHLEVKPGRRLRLVLEGTLRTPSFEPSAWIVVLAEPPDHAWQEVRSHSLRLMLDRKEQRRVDVETLVDAAVPGRRLQRLHYKPRGAASAVRYLYEVEVVLNAVRLEKGRAKKAPKPLAKDLREAALAARGAYDFEKPAFQAWLDQHDLRRKKRERDLAFAYRTLAHIHEAFTYRFPPKFTNRLATEVCEEKASDCGGLSILFASVMRASGVPARVLPGRWALIGKKGESQYHVRAEFWAEGIGWVPIDGSGAVQWAGAPASAFGGQRPNFFVMHEDIDVDIDTVYFGVHPIRLLQNPAYWVRGQGKFSGVTHESTWRVEELKLAR
jgi:hypothetical protein